MRRNWIFLMFLLLNCLLLGGCGGKADRDSGAESGNGSGAESDNGSTSISMVSEGEELLFIKEIRSIHFEKPEEGYETTNTFYDAMDGRVYLFRAECRLDETGNFLGSDRICVQIYDSQSQKVKQHVLTPEVPQYEEYRLVSAGLTADEEISLKLAERGKKDDSCILVKTDLQGTVLEVADPFPDEALYPWNVDSWSNTKVFHLTDGRTILSRWDEAARTATLAWFGGENSGQTLGRLEGEFPSAFCSDEEGILYCMTGSSLFRWNAENNTMEGLFRLNGVETGNSSCLIPVGEGEFLLCRINEEKALAYVLTDRKPENNEKIRLSCVQEPMGIGYINQMAGTFAAETGSIPVVLEQDEKYQDDYRNRIFAELAAGKGPEIMLLSREDMLMLAEKGALCDLSDMIPEDIKENMIPGALELGMADGKLVGFTPQVEFDTIITSDKTWAKDGWSISDFKGLAESGEDIEILVGIGSVNAFHGGFSPGSLLLNFFLGDETSPWLDPEQGISRFDSEEFIQVLELCKKYGRNAGDIQIEQDESYTMLKEGKIAALYTGFSDFFGFSELMAIYGEGCHIAGIPTNTGSGNYVKEYSLNYLAVNANAEHKEDIAKFIAYLLDYDNQSKVAHRGGGSGVRMDVIRDSVFCDEYGIYRVRYGDWVSNALKLKPDGTTWLEEYLNFLENCEPERRIPSQIISIVYGEAKSYFEGDKSAGDVAKIIHNRVQLYLDENS